MSTKLSKPALIKAAAAFLVALLIGGSQSIHAQELANVRKWWDADTLFGICKAAPSDELPRITCNQYIIGVMDGLTLYEGKSKAWCPPSEFTINDAMYAVLSYAEYWLAKDPGNGRLPAALLVTGGLQYRYPC